MIEFAEGIAPAFGGRLQGKQQLLAQTRGLSGGQQQAARLSASACACKGSRRTNEVLKCRLDKNGRRGLGTSSRNEPYHTVAGAAFSRFS